MTDAMKSMKSMKAMKSMRSVKSVKSGTVRKIEFAKVHINRKTETSDAGQQGIQAATQDFRPCADDTILSLLPDLDIRVI